MAGEGAAIHNAIITAAKAAVFYPVSYNPTTRVRVDDTNNPIAPSSVYANEIQAGWSTGQASRRKLTLARDEWLWELHVQFDLEVSCQAFEESLASDPLRVTATTTLRAANILLLSSRYTHPQQHQPTTGTRVVYTLAIQLLRTS